MCFCAKEDSPRPVYLCIHMICVDICGSIHICIYVCVYVVCGVEMLSCTHTQYAYMPKETRPDRFICIYTCVYMQICIYLCVYVDMYICVCVYVCA